MIARVLVDINLPQVDRLFDFEIPEHLLAIAKPGLRVRVEYGRSKKLVDGLIVEIAESSEFDGTLKVLAEVVSDVPVLKPGIYELIRMVADRQVVSAAEVMRNAIPVRSIRVEKSWLDSQATSVALPIAAIESAIETLNSSITPWKFDTTRSAVISEPKLVEIIGETSPLHPVWAANFLLQALKQLSEGKSTILCVPDFRDQAVIERLANQLGLSDALVSFTGSLMPSKRYSAFLKCLGGHPLIVVGNRGALWAPVAHLGLVAVWDDDDDSMYDQSSPYCAARELALMRNSIDGGNLIFAAHSRSVQVQRLIEIGYLGEAFVGASHPSVAISERTSRISPSVFSAVKRGLDNGPVLVQVSALGSSTSLYCAGCGERAHCRECNGPLWSNKAKHVQCRWCSALNDDFRCRSCEGNGLRPGKPGASRTLEQFGSMLPGVALKEFSGESTEVFVDSKPRLIVATPGSEPLPDHGYSAVVILDAQDMLYRDTIDASPDAVKNWMNAVSKLATGGEVLLAGLEGELATLIAEGRLRDIAHRELDARRELNFPPAVRIASIEGEIELITTLRNQIDPDLIVDILGPTAATIRGDKPSRGETLHRMIIRFHYSKGTELSAHLRELALRLGAGKVRVSSTSGRSIRPIKIKMDDRSVL